MKKNVSEGKTIASVAASTVDGYLRNASKRHRIPTAEGGRGTRRKIAMVTSANTGTVEEDVEKVDVDEDEWDEVELVNSVKIQKMEELVPLKTDVTVKEDISSANVEEGHVKQEESAFIVEDFQEDLMIPGVTRPLTEGGQRKTPWSRNDPAYAAMLEEKDLLAAERKSKRIQETNERIFSVMSILLRGKLLWRESQHPVLRKALLCVKVNGTGKSTENFPFIDLVRECRQLLKKSNEEKPSLAPSWVTLGKDTAHTKTSHVVENIITAINSVFTLSKDDANSDFSHWSVPFQKRYLIKLLLEKSKSTVNGTISLVHPVYFTLIFLSLARAIGLSCRLVVSKPVAKNKDAVKEKTEDGRKKLSIFGDEEKKPKAKPKGLPSSFVWAEVWCAERGIFLSVNPCGGCSTVWGAPYTFSINGDTAVDVTPRYITKYSTAFHFNRRLGKVSQYSFLWRDIVAWDDTREVSQVLLDSLNAIYSNPNGGVSALTLTQRTRENKQLNSLKYSESIPTTITGVLHHPLFVMESQLSRFEAIYPKDASTTVGSVKGHMVYKSSAVVNLRSRDGWLRLGRSLKDPNEEPYKTVAPPASRPFAAHSHFYGFWQTKPFCPLSLEDGERFPSHGRTTWYILFDQPPPEGIVHLTQPNISRVARRMRLDFRACVTGFVRRRGQEHRRGFWEASIDGIVVRQVDAASLLKAYKEWVELTEEQEAAKKRERAFRWWLLLSQRLLSMDRLQTQYLQGSALGALPSA